MPMTSKTMVFDTIDVSYNYNTGRMMVQAKSDENKRDTSKGAIELSKEAIAELKEALAGIGQQVSPTYPPGARRG